MKTIFRAFFILTLLPFAAEAQNAVLRGQIVFEGSLEPAAGYRVAVVQGDFRAEQSATQEGAFSFGNLPSGLCNIRVSSPDGQSFQVLHEQMLNGVKPLELLVEVERPRLELNEVSVSAQAFKTTEETPLSIKNINWSEMQRMPGATLDISKAIQSFPGVLPKSSFGYNISIRGGASSENSYRMDGIDLPTINHFSIQGASGGAVSLLNMDFIQGAALYSGAFPSSMSNVLSGALELDLRQARSDRPGVRMTLGATDVGATVEMPLSKRSGLMVSARNSFSQHYFKLFNIPVLPTYQDAQFKYYTRIGDHADLTVLGVGGWDSYRVYKEGRGSDALLYNVGYIPEGQQSTEVLGARYRRFRSNGLQTLVLSRDRITNDADKFVGNTSDEADRQLRYRSYEDRTRIRYERVWDGENSKFTIGGSLEAVLLGVDMWALKGSISGIDTTNLQSTLGYGQAGLFTSYAKTSQNGRGTLNLGLRMDASNFNLNMVNPLAQLSPRASYKYQLTSHWTANSHVGRYQQMPAGILLAANRATNHGRFTRFTTTDHLGAGVEYQNGKTYRVSMEVYSKRYRNAPFLVNDQIAYANAIGAYVAVGDQPSIPNALGRARGFELFLQQKLKGHYWWMGSYNYGISEFQTASGDWAPSVWDSRHTLSLTTGKVWGKGWQWGLKWRYSSGTPYTPFNESASALVSNWDILQRGVFDYAQVNSQRLASFTQLDFRIDKTYSHKGWSLSWFLDLQNLASGDIPLMPYLTVVRDADTKAPLLDPNDPTRYQMQLLRSDTGRTLPTIGMILEF
ncbi:MAG: TonB-dependent receptor [Schleiferiaceae bacterium]